MFLNLAYLPSKLPFSGKYLFSEHQISAGQLSADSFSAEATKVIFMQSTRKVSKTKCHLPNSL